MGFPESQAQAALRAAFGNVDRAIEYLTMGMPTGMDTSDDDAPRARPTTSASNPSASSSAPTAGGSSSSTTAASAPATASAAPSASGAGAGGLIPGAGIPPTSPLAPLAHNPNFMQMRALVQRQPDLLPSLMRQLAQNNPDLVRLINENQEDFYQLLNALPVGGGPGGPGGRGMGGTIAVTPEENEAIERLAALGFDKNLAAQAYFACDKDENMAANWLMENGYDDN